MVPGFVSSNILSKRMVCKGEIMLKMLEVELQLKRNFWVEKSENS